MVMGVDLLEHLAVLHVRMEDKDAHWAQLFPLFSILLFCFETIPEIIRKRKSKSKDKKLSLQIAKNSKKHR